MKINGFLVFAISGIVTYLLTSEKGKGLLKKTFGNSGITGKLSDNSAKLNTKVEIGNNSSFSLFGK